jgi:hypothetical protein
MPVVRVTVPLFAHRRLCWAPAKRSVATWCWTRFRVPPDRVTSVPISLGLIEGVQGLAECGERLCGGGIVADAEEGHEQRGIRRGVQQGDGGGAEGGTEQRVQDHYKGSEMAFLGG